MRYLVARGANSQAELEQSRRGGQRNLELGSVPITQPSIRRLLSFLARLGCFFVKAKKIGLTMRQRPIGALPWGNARQGDPRPVEGRVVGGHTAFAATRSTGGERAVPQMAVLPRRRYLVNE